MATYFEFEVSLEEVQPKIWRTFLLRSDLTFHELHDTIQKACGWQDYHLYQFMDTQTRQRIAESPYDNECPAGNEVKIDSVFREVDGSCFYEYDFGDGWWHMVTLKSITKIPGQFRRKLTGGQRAFPPEDCGGIMGYEESVDALLVPDSKLKDMDEYAKEDLLSRREWLGNWHPEHFDFEATAKQLKRPIRSIEL